MEKCWYISGGEVGKTIDSVLQMTFPLSEKSWTIKTNDYRPPVINLPEKLYSYCLYPRLAQSLSRAFINKLILTVQSRHKGYSFQKYRINDTEPLQSTISRVFRTTCNRIPSDESGKRKALYKADAHLRLLLFRPLSRSKRFLSFARQRSPEYRGTEIMIHVVLSSCGKCAV